MAVVNKVIAYVASPYAGGAFGQSANMSVTLPQQTAEQLRVALVAVHPASQSSPPEAYFYLSNDGGTAFETYPSSGFSFSRGPGTTERKVVTLPGGAWAIKLVTGGIPHTNYSISLAVLTVEVVTANVIV